MSNLQELQEELSDLADKIQSVDARGSKGININTRLDDLDQELTRIATELEVFESANDLEIDVNLKGMGSEIAEVRTQLAGLRASEDATIPININTQFDDLDQELSDLINKIQKVDKRGSEGININTQFDDLDQELSDLINKIQKVDKRGSEGININTQFDSIDKELSDLIDKIQSVDTRGSEGININTQFDDIDQELSDLIDKIQSADRRGSKGIDINTRLDDLDQELTRIATELDAFEATNDLEIDVDLEGLSGEVAKVRSQLAALRASEGITISADVKRATRVIPQGDFGDMSLGDMSSAFSVGGMGPSFDSKLVDRVREFRQSMKGAKKSISQFDLRMTDMHNMLARLIPLLLVFIGAVPAVVTALAGLAAAAVSAASALLAIAGFGALGVGMEGGEFDMENLSEVMDELRRDFLDAFAPLAERLEPVFRDAADAMTLFFNAISRQGDALMELTDDARAFGQFMMDWVPEVLTAMASMAEAFSPVFGAIGDALNDAQVLRTLTKLAMEAIPAIAQMADIIVAAIPSLIRMSIGFAIVANQIMNALGAIGSLLRTLGISPEIFGLVTGGLLALASAAALLSAIANGLVGVIITRVVGAMAAWFYSTLLLNKGIAAMAINTIAKAIVSIYGYITTLLGAKAATLSMASATMIATGALAAFLTLATLGVLGAVLVPMATAAASRFTILGDSIQGATDSLKEFDRVAGQTDSDFNPYSGGGGGGGSSAPSAAVTGPNGNVIIESSGDPNRDRSNGRYASWRNGRTTGSEN